MTTPPIGDVNTAREPYVRVRAGMSDKIPEHDGTVGAPGQERMHGHAHDLGTGGALVVEVVELIDEQAEQLPRAARRCLVIPAAIGVCGSSAPSNTCTDWLYVFRQMDARLSALERRRCNRSFNSFAP